MNKKQILKQIILKEIKKIMEEPEPKPVLDSSIDILLDKFPSLKAIVVDFFTNSYKDYIKDIFVIAPKPTTFKILLDNGQYFFLTYNGKSYDAKVSGKTYNLLNLGEEERAIKSVADLLTIGKPAETEGPATEIANATTPTPEEIASPEGTAASEEEETSEIPPAEA
jgi:hypothetical protein